MQKALVPLIRPPLLNHSVQEAIRQFILDNSLRPGDPLPSENELARQLGVSRNSVREAVKGLDSLGIIEARRGSGLFVREFSFEPLLEGLSYGLLFDLQELDELLEIRRVLETGLIAQALDQLPETALAAIQREIEQMRALAEQGTDFPEEDRRFHQLLFENLGNRTLLKLLDIFWLTYRKASKGAELRNTNPLQTYRDHAAIYDAIATRDAEQARIALDRHYAVLKERLTQVRTRVEGTDDDGSASS